MKLPKKPLEQARAQPESPKIGWVFKSESQAGDIDYRYHPHYDNQPRPDDGTPARQTWRFGVPEVATAPEYFAKRSEASHALLRQRLEGTVRQPRVFSRRAEPVKPRESMFSKYARLERERQSQSLGQKPELQLEPSPETPKPEQVEILNLESQPEVNFERQAQLEQRKTGVLTSFKKSSSVLSDEPKHVQKARALKTKYESRASENLEQKADAHLEGLRRPDFDVNTNPLAAISEHFITKSNQNVPTRAFEREQHIVQAVRPAASNLIRTARGTGFKTNQLTSAIQRFTDPTANKAVRTGIMTNLHHSPSLQLEVQRSLQASDLNLEVQREQFLTEARESESNSSLSERIANELNAGVPLEENIRKQLEAHFNTDLSKVRIHTDGKAHELAKSANATAFTTGQNIFFQTGKFDPSSSVGFELLAHETAHTIQQGLGQVSPGIDASSSLESEAKLEGRKAVGNKGNLEKQATNFNDFLLKPNLESGIAAKTVNLERKSVAVQREPVKTEAPATKTEEAQGTKLNLRGAAFNETYPVKLRSSMETSSETNVVSKIPFGTTFLITESISSWYKIKLDSGQTGFVAGENISVAPDSKAEFYKIKAGDNAIDIAEKYYKAVIGLDLRFYVGVLAKLNPRSIKMPDGIDWSKGSSVMAWKKANPMVGYFIWIPSQAYAQTLKGSVNNGKISDHPLEAAAEVGKGIVKKTIKELGGDKVIATLESIGQNVQLVWDNPEAFVKNLTSAVKTGFTQFTGDIGTHLQSGMVSVVTGQLGGQVNLSKGFSPTGMLDIGLQLMHLTPTYFEGQLEKNVPGGVKAVQGVKEAASFLSDINSNGLAPTIKSYFENADALKDQIFESLKTWARDTVVKKALAVLASTLIPGAGIVQAAIKIYETITFIWEKFKLISKTLEAITGSLADIANGRIDSAVKKIVSSLVGGLSLAIGFLVKISGLGGIADRIKAFFTNIRGKIDAAIKKVIDKFKVWVGGKSSSTPVAGDKTDGKTTTANTKLGLKDGIYGKESFTAGKEPHAVWLEVSGGHPNAMIASTAKPAKPQLDGWRDEALQKGLQAQVDPYIGQAMGIVTRAVKNLNKAASTNSVSAVTIDQMWKNDGKALVRVVTVIRNALGPEVNYAFVTDANGVKRTKLVTISFLCPANLSQAGLRGEFTKQVQRQQEGLNKLSVPEWFTNRSSFLSAGRSNSEQRKFRENNKDNWVISKAAEIQSRPYNQELLVQLQKVLTTTELSDLQDVTKTPRVAAARARTIAEAIWSQQAALHDPDQNAGGNATGISGLGDKDVNSSIGSQWKDRVYLIDREVAKIPEILRPDLKLNTRLRSQ